MKRAAAAGLGALLLAGGAWWAWTTWCVVRPSFPMIEVQTPTFRALNPAHWPNEFDHPKLPADRKSHRFLNRYSLTDAIGHEKWDRPRLIMRVEDRGDEFESVDAMVEEIRSGGINPSEVSSWTLENGIEAKTWTHEFPTMHLVGIIRWVAFQAPNGHFYTATWDEAGDWQIRWRYEHLFKQILGSMEFKDGG